MIYTATCPECKGIVAWASPKLSTIRKEVATWGLRGFSVATVDKRPDSLGHDELCTRRLDSADPVLCTECGKEAGPIYREVAGRTICGACKPLRRCDDCGGLLEHKGTPNWMNCFQCVECGKKVSR